MKKMMKKVRAPITLRASALLFFSPSSVAVRAPIPELTFSTASSTLSSTLWTSSPCSPIMLASFPKIKGVWQRVRDLPSYSRSYTDAEKRPVICTEDWFKAMGFEVSYYPLEGVIENY